MALHMEEGDRWFDQMHSQMDEQEEAMKRMHTVSESLLSTRRELASIGESFSKVPSSLSILPKGSLSGSLPGLFV